jgi:hypothetical protein
LNHELQWSVYEANVQSYRNTFNASQSMLLAFGALLYEKNIYLFSLIAVTAVILIWFVWFRVITKRTLIVDYHKIFIDPKYDIPPKDIGEKEYVDNKTARKEFNAIAGMKTNWRLTRIKMEVVLPVVYSLMWIFMLLLFWAEKLCVAQQTHTLGQ